MATTYDISNGTSNPIDNTLQYDCTSCQAGGSVVSIFKDLAVPAGLLYLQQKNHVESTDYVEEKSQEPISQSLFDKLYELAEASPNVRKRKKTRRKMTTKANKTRRV